MAIALSGASDGHDTAGTSSQVASSENKKTSAEMVGGCSVCPDDQGTEENPLVYCDGCELAVHQACYGIISVPSGAWFCRKCEQGDSQTKIKCELCPSKDGALKKTETGQWAHVVCALYIPEVRFGNNNTMEPIEIKHILADRYNRNCYICEESGNSSTASYGAVMYCNKSGCRLSFHVTCAQTAGLLCEEAGQSSDDVTYCGYCKHHFRKLKAVNRKSGNSLSSNSYLDSASDSSQDNDSRRNATKQDKNSNRTNKPSSLPTNLTTSASLANNSHSQPLASTTATINATLSANNAPISLTLPLSSMGSSPSKSSSSTAAASQKKRKASKSASNNSNNMNNNFSTLLSTIDSSPATSLAQQSSTAQNSGDQLETSAAEDVYKWTEKDTPDKAPSSNNTSSASANNKNSKKKQSPSTQASSQRAAPTSQAMSTINFNMGKTGSPNLSLSTSPSLASPSNSTKSTSNSSTSISTTTAASSALSTSSSNSPSPALLSPNVSYKGSTVRQESPLASNSKTGTNNLHNRPQTFESATSNVALPFVHNSLQTRINLDNPKNDLKKNTMASSSLLSTAVPMSQESLANTAPSSSSTTTSKLTTAYRTDHLIPPPQQVTAFNAQTSSVSLPGGLADGSMHSLTGQSNLQTSATTQPTVPPLIIPMPQVAATPAVSSAKPTARARPAPKSTKKKPNDAGNEPAPKPEPKPKPSRSRKAPAAASSNNGTSGESSSAKPEPKRGAKTAEASGSSAGLNGGAAAKNQVTAPTPTKRKSRAASNESSAALPTPTKRARKKKADTVPPGSDTKTTVGNSTFVPTSLPNPDNWQSCPTSLPTGHLLQSSTCGPMSTGPLMINTPTVNKLITSAGSLDSQDAGGRYFSPMISPYANFDHLNQSSLSRSSLSRLFTSSSVDINNPANSADDPARAFEELRDNTWSQLSKCVLDQAQQFDIPSLIGTLYALRTENEKLVNRVRDLTMKRDQLVAVNARLDLPGPLLTQHLNNTSPNFSSVVSRITNSPKSLPTPSLMTPGSYNQAMSTGSLGHPGLITATPPYMPMAHTQPASPYYHRK